MKRNLTLGVGIFSAFAFLVTFLIGLSVSAQSVWKDFVPFLGVMIALAFVLSSSSCCRSRKSC